MCAALSVGDKVFQSSVVATMLHLFLSVILEMIGRPTGANCEHVSPQLPDCKLTYFNAEGQMEEISTVDLVSGKTACTLPRICFALGCRLDCLVLNVAVLLVSMKFKDIFSWLGNPGCYFCRSWSIYTDMQVIPAYSNCYFLFSILEQFVFRLFIYFPDRKCSFVVTRKGYSADFI